MDVGENYFLSCEINHPNSFKIWNYASLGGENVNKFEFWREGKILHLNPILFKIFRKCHNSLNKYRNDKIFIPKAD